MTTNDNTTVPTTHLSTPIKSLLTLRLCPNDYMIAPHEIEDRIRSVTAAKTHPVMWLKARTEQGISGGQNVLIDAEVEHTLTVKGIDGKLQPLSREMVVEMLLEEIRLVAGELVENAEVLEDRKGSQQVR